MSAKRRTTILLDEADEEALDFIKMHMDWSNTQCIRGGLRLLADVLDAQDQGVKVKIGSDVVKFL